MNARIKEQILAIRDMGVINMFDAKGVQWIAHEEGYYELVAYIEENKRSYGNFIMTGKGLED
jgi:hypothetical protein